MKILLRRYVIRFLLLLTSCILVASVAITLANYIPLNLENKITSLTQLSQEGYFPEVPSTAGGYGTFQSMNPTALELATDNLMVKMATYEGEGQGIQQAFRCYSTQYEEEYSRYWHGYVTILRPLLYFFNYYEIRLLNGFLQMLLFLVAVLLIYKQKGLKYSIAIAITYFLLMPMALSQCLQYTWIYYTSFGALVIYLLKKKYWDYECHYLYLFLLIGALTNFLDLLTYPLLSWGLLITWIIILKNNDSSKLFNIIQVILSGLIWILGYAGMWFGKWVMGSLILHENLFKKAISEALLWTVNEGASAITINDRLNAISINWRMYIYRLFLYLLLFCIFYTIFKGFEGYRKDSRIPSLALICCSSLVWYFLLAGHSLMHHIFTHRTYSVSIAAFLGIVLLCTEKEKINPTLKIKLFQIPTIIILCLISIFLMLQIKEDYQVTNWEYSFVKEKITDCATITLTPKFSNITEVRLGLTTNEGTEGKCIISIQRNQQIIDSYSLSVEGWDQNTLVTLPVEWNLLPKEEYTLVIEPYLTNGDLFISLTEQANFPIAEIGEGIVDNTNTSRQPLVNMTYHCRPVGKIACIFWIATIYSILTIIWVTIYSCIPEKKDKLTKNC